MGTTLCGRTPGIWLSEVGEAQARGLGEYLRGRNLEAIYSSPLERAQQTAQQIGRPLGIEPQTEPRIDELNFGAWTGRTFAELAREPDWDTYNRNRSAVTPPSGEAPLDALARSREALDDRARQHDGSEIAFVTHADVIRSLLTSLLGMSLDSLLRFEIEPASVSEVSIGGDYPVLHSCNARYAL